MKKILLPEKLMRNLLFILFFFAATNYISAQKNEELLQNVEIKNQKQYISLINNNIENINNEIKHNKKLSENVKNELEIIKKDYNKLAFYAYKTRNIRQKTIYILAAEDFNQAYERFKYLCFFTDYFLTKSKDLKKINDSLTDLNEKLENDTKNLKKLKKNRNNELKKLNSKKLQEKLKNKTKNEKNKPKSKETIAFEKRKGKLDLPVSGAVTSSFGKHKHPVLRNVTTINNGIEITVTGSNEVKAVFKGFVSKVVIIPGANKAILLKHGQYFTVYSNLSEVFVRENQEIKANQKIGKVFRGKNNSSSNILDFQIWYGNEKLNPKRWLK